MKKGFIGVHAGGWLLLRVPVERYQSDDPVHRRTTNRSSS